MDVRCPQCATVYELEDHRIKGPSLTLKCSLCGHLFALAVPGRGGRENQRRWMVRMAASGDIFYCKDLGEVHRWVLERRIDAQDVISRSGESWRELGSIGEFAPVFLAVQGPPKSRLAPIEAVPAVVGSEAGVARVQTLGGLGAMPQPLGRVSAMPAVTPGGEGAAKPWARWTPTSVVAAPRAVPETLSPAKASSPRSVATVPLTQLPPSVRERPSRPNPALGPAPERAGRLQRRPSAPDNSDDAWSMGHGADSFAISRDLVAADDDDAWGSDGPGSLAQGTYARPWMVGLGAFVVLLVAIGTAVMFGTGEAEDSREVTLTGATVGGEEREANAGDANAGVANGANTVALGQAEAVRAARAAVESAVSRSLETARQPPSPLVLREGSRPASARPEQTPAPAPAKRNASALVVRGRRENQEGRYQAALASYRQALALEPYNAAVLTGMGRAHMGLGQMEQAVSQFRRAIQNNARHSDAYIALGSAYRKMGDREGALDAYERCLRFVDSGPDAEIARRQSERLRAELGR